MRVNVCPRRTFRFAALALAPLVFLGCSTPAHRAPVEERFGTPRATVSAATPVPSAPSAAASGVAAADGATKPGYYAVKPGDTLIRIGLDTGQNWKDLVRWNNLENPNLIEVGQVLRVYPPGADPTVAASRPVGSTRVEARPLPSAGASAPIVAAAPSPAPAPAVASPAAAPAPAAIPREGDDDIAWGWPASASVSAPFDESRNKGLVFKGKAGDPVYAAADGRVVYAGSGLRGYGNLIILKHNATYLTAYAHNQTLLVKDDQSVKKGQKIAEMGSSDADGVQLHFEVRRQGKPIDPARLLPAR